MADNLRPAWQAVNPSGGYGPGGGGELGAGAVVAVMVYDAAGRRTGKRVLDSGDWDHRYQYYHDGGRVIEERNAAAGDDRVFGADARVGGGDDPVALAGYVAVLRPVVNCVRLRRPVISGEVNS